MQKWITSLTTLFVVQLILIVLLNANSLRGTHRGNDETLLAHKASELTEILIETQGQAPLLLRKENQAWTMPEYFGLRVSQTKIDGFLEKLEALKKTWPVATSSAAQERFEVAPEQYQRKLTLKTGDDSKTFFLGTSPGYRKTHLRMEDHSDIYSVEFSNFEATAEPKTWLDGSLLALDAARMTKVSSNRFTLESNAGKWSLLGLSDNEISNETQLQEFATQLANLSVDEALSDKPDSDWAKLAPELEVKINFSGELKPVDYRFSLSQDKSHYVLKSTQSPIFFRLSKAQGDKVVDITRDSLVTTIQKPEPQTASQPESEEPTPKAAANTSTDKATSSLIVPESASVEASDDSGINTEEKAEDNAQDKADTVSEVSTVQPTKMTNVTTSTVTNADTKPVTKPVTNASTKDEALTPSSEKTPSLTSEIDTKSVTEEEKIEPEEASQTEPNT